MIEIIKLYAHNCVEEITNIIKNKKECFVYGIPDKNYVFRNGGTLDQEYCETNNIEILSIPTHGGSLIVGEEDIELGYFTLKPDDKFLDKFINSIIEYLKYQNIHAEYKDNDILINNRKFCGVAANPYNDLIYVAIHISINVNMDLIKQICTKPMEKIPVGLKEYGITNEELLTHILKFVENFGD